MSSWVQEQFCVAQDPGSPQQAVSCSWVCLHTLPPSSTHIESPQFARQEAQCRPLLVVWRHTPACRPTSCVVVSLPFVDVSSRISSSSPPLSISKIKTLLHSISHLASSIILCLRASLWECIGGGTPLSPDLVCRRSVAIFRYFFMDLFPISSSSHI